MGKIKLNKEEKQKLTLSVTVETKKKLEELAVYHGKYISSLISDYAEKEYLKMERKKSEKKKTSKKISNGRKNTVTEKNKEET